MFVGVGITVGRDLDGNVVPTNSSDLPVNLYVGNLGAYRFVGMEGTPIPVRATPFSFLSLFLSFFFVSLFSSPSCFFSPCFAQLSLLLSLNEVYYLYSVSYLRFVVDFTLPASSIF